MRRHCWRDLRRHRFRETGAFRFGPGFDRGVVLICRDCSHDTAAVGQRLDRLIELGERKRK